MPTYAFQCHECGLRFEKLVSIKDHKNPQPCIDCGEPADRWVPDSVHGSFQTNVTGPLPQNTGASQVDTDYDRVIGSSSQQGWDVQEKRYKDKMEIIRTEGVEGADLSRNPDGTYHVLDKEERKAYETATKLHRTAQKVLRESNPR